MLQALAVAALLAAVALVISGLVPGSSGRLRDAARGWIAVAVALELIACAGYAALFAGVYAHGEHRIGVVRGAQIGLGELGAYVVVPTGAGGPALRIWALMRSGVPFRLVMRRGVTHAAIFQIPYVVVAVLLGLGAVLGVGSGHAHVALALAPLAIVVAAVAFVAGAALLARRPPRRSPTRWQRVGRDVLDAIPDGVRDLPGRLREPVLLLGAIAYWAGDCGVLVVAVHAVHGSAPLAVIVLAYMLGQLGNALPLPGGVGAVEPAMLGVLTSSGVNLAVGAAAVVLYRFISLGMQAAAGAVAVGTLIPSLQRSPAPQRAE